MSSLCCYRLGAVGRKRICFVLTALYFILAGMEYSIILPTIWLFLTERFGSETYMAGLVTTAYFVSSFISSPIMGSVYDRFRDKVKLIMIFAAICELTGSIMYFISFSAWFLVCARLVAGFGNGVYSVFYAMIARVTIAQERTKNISRFEGCRQLGIFLGPGFNVIFMNREIELWNYTIDSYTLPGVVMAVLWALYLLVLLALYQDFSQDDVDTLICIAEKAHDQNTKPEVAHSNNINHGNVAEHNKAFELEICDDDDKQMGKESLEDLADIRDATDDVGGDSIRGDGDVSSAGHNSVKFDDDGTCTNDKSAPSNEDDLKNKSLVRRVLSRLYNEYLYDDIVAVMFLSFVTFFNIVGLETMVAPLSYQVLGWREVNTSFLFMGIAVEIIVTFLILMKLSVVFSDRALLRAAQVMEIAGCISLMLFVPNTPEKSSWNLLWLLPIITLQVFGTPFLLTCSRSLLTKITPEETQGLTQGLLRVAENLACIFGPLWVGGALHNPWLMFAVMVAMYLISLVMLLMSYKKLKPKEKLRKRTQHRL